MIARIHQVPVDLLPPGRLESIWVAVDVGREDYLDLVVESGAPGVEVLQSSCVNVVCNKHAFKIVLEEVGMASSGSAFSKPW